MSAVAYRDATVADAAAIAGLFERSFTETFGHLYAAADLKAFLDRVNADAFAAELADRNFELRLAVGDGQPVGFAKLGPASLPVDTPPDTLELWQIYVLRSWQGEGIGPALYGWVEGRARARGAGHLQLSVYVDNHRARAFYERRGFVAVGRYDFMVGSHADEDIVMRKQL
jgi:diamine N-acetyltransferase